MSLFADNIILHIENPKESPRQLLELINDFRGHRSSVWGQRGPSVAWIHFSQPFPTHLLSSALSTSGWRILFNTARSPLSALWLGGASACSASLPPPPYL